MKPKFRSWVENVRHPKYSFMQYEPEFNGEINKIFEKNGEIQHGVKVSYMQSTGLKDKDGVEIFFDDALTDGIMTRLVIWREDDSQIQLSVDDAEYENRIKLTQNMINTFGLTICGNIYENPELLEVEG